VAFFTRTGQLASLTIAGRSVTICAVSGSPSDDVVGQSAPPRLALRRRLRGAAGRARHALAWAALASSAAVAHGDWIVTREGREIETRGPWRVEGPRVLLTSVSGTLQAIPLSEVDLERSHELTQRRLGQPRQLYPAPPVRQVAPLARERRASPPRLQPDEVATVGPSSADVYVPARQRDGGRRFETSLRVSGTSHDNFFEAGDDEPQAAMKAAEAEALLSWRPAPERRHRIYLQATRTELEDLPATDAFRLGVRFDHRRHMLDFSSRLQHGYAVRDLDGDAPEPVERRSFAGRYQLRPVPSWSLELTGELEEERPTLATRNADTVGVAIAARYRGFARFTPEVGALWAERTAVSASREYDERGGFLKLRFAASERLAFEVRGRQRERAFTISDRQARNFDRVDVGRDLSAAAHLLVLDDVVLSLRYEVEENDSSREGRSYSASRFGLGVGLRLDGGREGSGQPGVSRHDLASSADPTPDRGGDRAAVRPPAEPLPRGAEVVAGEPPSEPDPGRLASAAAAKPPAAELPAPQLPAAAAPADPGLPTPAAPAAQPIAAAPAPARTPRAASDVPRSSARLPSSPPRSSSHRAAAGPSFGGVTVATRDAGRTAIDVHGTGLDVRAAFLLRSPDRYVVDLQGVETPRSATVPVGSALVQRVRIGQFQPSPPGVVRVVFDLERPLTPRLEPVAGGLRVTFETR
jgi:hypothetical protein